jgi:DNA-directed RNA polymerase subunit RPC12/RpoP
VRWPYCPRCFPPRDPLGRPGTSVNLAAQEIRCSNCKRYFPVTEALERIRRIRECEHCGSILERVDFRPFEGPVTEADLRYDGPPPRTLPE